MASQFLNVQVKSYSILGTTEHPVSNMFFNPATPGVVVVCSASKFVGHYFNWEDINMKGNQRLSYHQIFSVNVAIFLL